MGKLFAKVCLIWLLFVCGSVALDSCAWEQEAPGVEGRITANDAKVLEQGLNTILTILPRARRLIRHYFMEMLASRKPELQEKRETHIFWLIEHIPSPSLRVRPKRGSCRWGSPEVHRVTNAESSYGYRR
jgi:hypothetical protein